MVSMVKLMPKVSTSLCVLSVVSTWKPWLLLDLWALVCVESVYLCDLCLLLSEKKGDSCCESTTKSICNYLVSLSHVTIHFDHDYKGGSLSCSCSCAAHCITSQSPPGAVCTATWKLPKASGTFTPCTNCKHPPPGINLSTDQSMSPGADKHASLGSVWLHTISLNSGNIPEKQTLQHLPYGERRATTANHNQRWEKSSLCGEAVSAKRARQAAIWTRALYKTHNFQLQEPGGLAYIATTCASGGSWAQCCCFSSSLSPAL